MEIPFCFVIFIFYFPYIATIKNLFINYKLLLFVIEIRKIIYFVFQCFKEFGSNKKNGCSGTLNENKDDNIHKSETLKR